MTQHAASDQTTAQPAGISHPRDNFDAIRLLAALIVLFGHAYYLTGAASMPAIFGNEIASIAVKVFFVISGYLVTESWRRDPSPSRYLWRRALRIFPALVVVTLLSTFVLGPLVSTLPLADYLHSPLIPRYLQNIILRPASLLPGVFNTLPYPNAVNGSLWTLPVEFGMYLIAPVLVLWGGGQKLRILLGCVALCVLSLYLNHFAPYALGAHGKPVHDALNVAPYFLLGAAWRIVAPQRVFNIWVALIALALMPFIPASSVAYEIGLYVVLPYAVLSLALARPATLGWAGRYGDFSYGVYIYAFPVQQTVALYFHTEGQPWMNAALSLLPTLLLAIASWHLVEKRFLLLKPHRRSVVRETVAARGATS
ncbi:acyltransferase [Paraburkholderia sp. DHOC27]|uniref:acyltransferase family protein n=1 Tax=Paraburkholderia sp. DHOC27 TaxID=2303330 RepID=UPI000E3E264B|nr:acyltransferase [Paraburkholderia sp. DHOC27]RFU46025.1 acyltransferase [Paraburkholderia sp. DHOC27]